MICHEHQSLSDGDEGSGRAGGRQTRAQHLSALSCIRPEHLNPDAGGRLDSRAIGLAVLAMAVLGAPYTVGKISAADLPVFGNADGAHGGHHARRWVPTPG